MDFERKIALIDMQIEEANGGHPADFDAWQNKTEVVLRSIFGETGLTHRKFEAVRYTPSMYTLGTDLGPYQVGGVQEAVTILESAKLELEIAHESVPTETVKTVDESRKAGFSSRVFIVHGQDEGKKYELESYLQKLLREAPVILHQEPNGGRVLIEKLEDSAGAVGYAIVLLTGDDVGRAKQLDSTEDQARARQNVVFEMGFFFGLIGRGRVAVLYEPGIEHPSDISGLVYIALDDWGGWKGKLASELDHAGIEVDWTAIGRT